MEQWFHKRLNIPELDINMTLYMNYEKYLLVNSVLTTFLNLSEFTIQD